MLFGDSIPICSVIFLNVFLLLVSLGGGETYECKGGGTGPASQAMAGPLFVCRLNDNAHARQSNVSIRVRSCSEMASYAPVGEPSLRSELPDFAERPNQPMKFNFPKRQFGKTKIVNRSFQSQWFQKWRWLHNDEACDLSYCNYHICIVAIKTGKTKNAGTVDSMFIARQGKGGLSIAINTE